MKLSIRSLKTQKVVLGLSFFMMAILVGIFFQNCGAKFQVQQHNSLINSSAFDTNPIDDSQWRLSAADVKQGEDFKVIVTLDSAADVATSFSYTTVDGTAIANEDFVPQSGIIAIESGQSAKEIVIPTLAYSEKINNLDFSIEVQQKTKKKIGLTIRPVYKKMAKFKKLVSAWANPGYCGITLNNEVLCFGGIRGTENNQGVWGASDQYGSVNIGISNAIDIRGGGASYCVLTSDQKIKCWGSSGGTYLSRMIVQERDFFPGVRVKLLSDYHEPWSTIEGRICVISADQEELCRQFTNQEMGTLINRGIVSDPVNALEKCNIQEDNYVLCDEYSKQVSAGPRIGMSQIPFDFRALKNYKIKNLNGPCFLTEEETVRCNTQNPVALGGLSDTKVLKLAGSRLTDIDYTCTLTQGGTVRCWRSNLRQSDQFTPLAEASEINGATDIAVSTPFLAGNPGPVRICAVLQDHSVVCSVIGNKSEPTLLTQIKKVAVGYRDVVCGITLSDKIACQSDGKIIFLEGLEANDQIVDLEILGNFNVYAVLASGKVKSWSGSELKSDFDSLSEIVNIEVGSYHACALEKSGKVYCWGENSYGQFGNNKKSLWQGSLGPLPTSPILAFNGQLADSISVGPTWTAIVPKKGSSLRAVGLLWHGPWPKMVDLFDYTP